MEKVKKNLEESIYSRLKNVARQRKRPVQEVLKYYAMERFLYRLGASSHKNVFYLKGGLMLMVWDPTNHRATVDIDDLRIKFQVLYHSERLHGKCFIEFNKTDIFHLQASAL